jgi:hypothetical protein
MNLPCPPSNKAEDGSIAALKRHAHDFMGRHRTDDNAGLSYLESADAYKYDTLVLRFAKRGPTWTKVMWMQPLMT